MSNARAILCSSRTTDHWGVTPQAEGDAESPGSGGAAPYRGVTPQAEGDAESPGSGGAAPYLRRGSRVNLRYKLALMGFSSEGARKLSPGSPWVSQNKHSHSPTLVGLRDALPLQRAILNDSFDLPNLIRWDQIQAPVLGIAFQEE
jgi:hypothetical protein